MKPIAIAIHGGAGTIVRSKLTREKEEECHSSLSGIVSKAYQFLKDGGSSLDAVELAVKMLEDDPIYNAGKGSVFTNQGNHELDAAIMCGKTLRAGAVSAVQHIRNPVQLARVILEEDQFLFLTGDGAEEFALHKKVPFVPNSYFSTEFRKQQFELHRNSHVVSLDHDGDVKEDKYGTVGAVALDNEGNLAAATSTGGLTNKRFGRVGDSPMIGAGTYANNKTCAISCTGKGEAFIRNVVAYDISCLIEYRGLSLKDACQAVIMEKLKGPHAMGGVIAMDHSGNIQQIFNTQGMYRAFMHSSTEKAETGIFATGK